MRRADIVCAVVLLIGAIVVAGEGLRLGIGWSTDGPQSGFFVFYLGLALTLSAAAVLGQTVFLSDAPLYRKPFVESGQLTPVLKVAAPAAAMILLTHWVGLYVAGALYLATYMRWIGRHAWPLTVVISVGIPLATFFIFELWFLVPMPKGPLETLLGF
jgi:putative tricarboxylic transport membrane protein